MAINMRPAVALATLALENRLATRTKTRELIIQRQATLAGSRVLCEEHGYGIEP